MCGYGVGCHGSLLKSIFALLKSVFNCWFFCSGPMNAQLFFHFITSQSTVWLLSSALAISNSNSQFATCPTRCLFSFWQSHLTYLQDHGCRIGAKAPVSRCPQGFYFEFWLCSEFCFVSHHWLSKLSFIKMKHNSSPFAQFIPLLHTSVVFPTCSSPRSRVSLRLSLCLHGNRIARCLVLIHGLVAQSGYGSQWIWWWLGALQSFAGSYCRHLKYFTAVGFHPGGHSCIDDEILGDACCSCSTRIQAWLQAWAAYLNLLSRLLFAAPEATGYDVFFSFKDLMRDFTYYIDFEIFFKCAVQAQCYA